jgi:ubiquinol-cytochrome c reductase subunit 8
MPETVHSSRTAWEREMVKHDQGSGAYGKLADQISYSNRVSLLGSPTQRGIISYGVSPNRQNPFAGAAHDAVFNTWRRFSAQVLYWAPGFVVGYYIANWAVDR